MHYENLCFLSQLQKLLIRMKKMLQKYLQFLVGRGFLEMNGQDNGRKHYSPTENGEDLLNHIEKVKALLGLMDHDADNGDSD